MSLSIKSRWEIVFLAHHPLGPKMSVGKIATYIKCSKSTVQKWISKYQETGDVQDDEGRGRKRKTSEKEDTQIISLSNKYPEMSAQEISQKMLTKGVIVSPTTIRRRFKEFGVAYKVPVAKPLLIENHCRARLKFAQRNIKTNWNQVIFTDETTFHFFTSKKKFWTRPQGGIIIRKVKHPAKLHMWGCFASSGFGKIFFFKNNLNADFLIQIYEEALLPSAKMLFPNDPNGWSLQEDNDPKHRSKKATEWRKQNHITRITWPSQSPDLNPIENVWALLKIKIQKKKCRTIRQLQSVITEEWNSLSVGYAKNLVDSVQRRLLAVKSNQGDYTLY